MADTIAEFLAVLGVKVDEAALQRFEQGIARLGRDAVRLTATMAAGVTAVTAAVTTMAESFERLYYLSQRTRTSVEDIKALQYAFGQVGLNANDAASAINSIALALRSNPGYGGLLKAWGIDPSESADKILTDLVHTFSRMQPYVAQQYAAMFGISPQMLLQLEQNLPRLEEAQRRYNDEARRAGVNQGSFAERSVEFLNSIRDVGATLELVFVKLSTDALPKLTEALRIADGYIQAHFGDIGKIGHSLDDAFGRAVDSVTGLVSGMDRLITATTGWKNALDLAADVIILRLFGPIGLIIKFLSDATNSNSISQLPIGSPLWAGVSEQEQGNYVNSPRSQRFLNPNGYNTQPFHWWNPGSWGGRNPNDPALATPPSAAPNGVPGVGPLFGAQHSSYSVGSGSNRFRAIEAAYSLPDGLLDRVWSAESGRGRFMTSSAGAQGHFQFMPGTAAQYGVADPNNLQQSANGAAHYLFDLLHHYSGSIAKALAAYNWGQGNLDRDVSQWGGAWMQHLPGETSRYLDRILGGAPLGSAGGGRGPAVINQQTHITVPGAADPVKTATEVAMAQRRVNSDLIRNFSGMVVA